MGHRTQPLLGYGTINGDAAMAYVTPRNVTDRITAENGVLCGSAPIVTSCNNKVIVESDVSF
jgi:hypothetical protein